MARDLGVPRVDASSGQVVQDPAGMAMCWVDVPGVVGAYRVLSSGLATVAVGALAATLCPDLVQRRQGVRRGRRGHQPGTCLR